MRETISPDLTRELEEHLRRNRQWGRLIDEQKFAVGLVDLRRPEAVRFAAVNGDTMMYAASLPKIAVLFAAFQAFEEGMLPESPAVLEDLEAMIRRSSNGAASRLIEQLGFERIASAVTDPEYRFYDPQHGGGLWVGRAYSKRSERHPDPLRGISHGANAFQVSRFYYLLASGKLLGSGRSRQMLRLLSRTGVHHKFVHILKDQVTLERVYRKSGTWKRWHCDSALVWEAGRRYILVGLVEHWSGERILRELVPVAEAALSGSRPAALSAQDAVDVRR